MNKSNNNNNNNNNNNDNATFGGPKDGVAL